MKGIITKIGESDIGLEYGFIRTENGDSYYFDNRYLADGSMADFYVDDTVLFEPLVTSASTNRKAKTATNVTLDLGEIEQSAVVSDSPNQTAINKQYASPKQESVSKDWYKHGPPPKSYQLSDFTNEEQCILQKLGEVLYPTNAGHFKTRINGINYGYSLFGPTKAFHIQLGMEKVEFAVIFCGHKDFQRRTLEESFFYLTHFVIPKVRISGHFFVLITKYSEIVSQIKNPEIQGALPYSIVPFSYEELIREPKETFETFILKRFKDHLFERDFFSYSEPINDRLFLFGGRDAFAKQIADRCASGDHSGIFGLRKSGKTSVINMIKQELDQRKICYYSYRCIEFTRHDWNDALFKIVKDLALKYGSNPPSTSYTESDALERFVKDLADISPNIGDRIVLIFDEIEQIAVDTTFDDKWQNPITVHLFWSSLITFCENYPGHLAIVIAGINPSINESYLVQVNNIEKTAPRNPMYNKLSNESYLKPFVFEQIRRMVNELGKYMGYHFSDEVCYELHKDFGGHPYFTRQMCKTIVEYIRKNGLKESDQSVYEITRQLYNAIKASGEFEAQSKNWCKTMLQELKMCYPEEYSLLVKIANRDSMTVKEIKKSTSIIPHLLGYGLVQFDPTSKEMDISIDVVRKYLISENEYKKPYAEMSISEIRDEIKDGIQLCEQPLRDLIFSVLTVMFQPSQAADFIRETHSFNKNQDKDVSKFSVSELLNPRLVTLQFYILKDIICSKSNTFGDHFEVFKNRLYPYTKAEIQSFFENLYVARNAADHHYEEISEGTLMNFRASLAEILKILGISKT